MYYKWDDKKFFTKLTQKEYTWFFSVSYSLSRAEILIYHFSLIFMKQLVFEKYDFKEKEDHLKRKLHKKAMAV